MVSINKQKKPIKYGDTACLSCLTEILCFCVKLRAASEYEERKLIRAAIRQIRDEPQQGESSCLMKWSQAVSVSLLNMITI